MTEGITSAEGTCKSNDAIICLLSKWRKQKNEKEKKANPDFHLTTCNFVWTGASSLDEQ